jgi:thiamine biosynthesis lipoprotein
MLRLAVNRNSKQQTLEMKGLRSQTFIEERNMPDCPLATLGHSWERSLPAGCRLEACAPRRLIRSLSPILLLMLVTSHRATASDLGLVRFEESQPHMGTLARIVVYAPQRDTAAVAFRAAFRRIETLNAIFSDYLPDSELNRLCQQAGSGPVQVSYHLFRILSQAQALAKESEGAFDVTAGPVIRLWRRARRQREVPTPERLAHALEHTGYQHLKLATRESTAELGKAGMLLDLGGIAKGYAVDEALKSLKECGIQSALVALGGDIVVSDPPPGKEGWTIEIAMNEFPALAKPKPLRLRHAAVSTSGDAEQHVEIGGIRYSHIIDPRTGKALTGRSSVTVTALSATESDGLATAISVLGPDRGLELVESTPGAAALMIQETEQGVKMFKSRNWRE